MGLLEEDRVARDVESAVVYAVSMERLCHRSYQAGKPVDEDGSATCRSRGATWRTATLYVISPPTPDNVLAAIEFILDERAVAEERHAAGLPALPPVAVVVRFTYRFYCPLTVHTGARKPSEVRAALAQRLRSSQGALNVVPRMLRGDFRGHVEAALGVPRPAPLPLPAAPADRLKKQRGLAPAASKADIVRPTLATFSVIKTKLPSMVSFRSLHGRTFRLYSHRHAAVLRTTTSIMGVIARAFAAEALSPGGADAGGRMLAPFFTPPGGGRVAGSDFRSTGMHHVPWIEYLLFMARTRNGHVVPPPNATTQYIDAYVRRALERLSPDALHLLVDRGERLRADGSNISTYLARAVQAVWLVRLAGATIHGPWPFALKYMVAALAREILSVEAVARAAGAPVRLLRRLRALLRLKTLAAFAAAALDEAFQINRKAVKRDDGTFIHAVYNPHLAWTTLLRAGYRAGGAHFDVDAELLARGIVTADNATVQGRAQARIDEINALIVKSDGEEVRSGNALAAVAATSNPLVSRTRYQFLAATPRHGGFLRTFNRPITFTLLMRVFMEDKIRSWWNARQGAAAPDDEPDDDDFGDVPDFGGVGGDGDDAAQEEEDGGSDGDVASVGSDGDEEEVGDEDGA